MQCMGSAGSACWGVGYVAGGCNVQCICYTDHGRYGLSCLYAETVESMSSAGSIWYVVYGLYDVLEFKLCCEILLLLNTVDMDQWKTVERAMQSTL